VLGVLEAAADVAAVPASAAVLTGTWAVVPRSVALCVDVDVDVDVDVAVAVEVDVVVAVVVVAVWVLVTVKVDVVVVYAAGSTEVLVRTKGPEALLSAAAVELTILPANPGAASAAARSVTHSPEGTVTRLVIRRPGPERLAAAL